MAGKDKEMPPISREEVEVDGVYTDEAGHEEHLMRGETFPADPVLGTTEWRLREYDFENHHEGRTDERMVVKAKRHGKQDKLDPRYSNADGQG
ncbi:transposase [Paenibacillus sp. F411]|nr:MULTISPECIES: transposase [Paenibacillus]MBO2945387.1 transposase [Paenibacillus sp. F411]